MSKTDLNRYRSRFAAVSWAKPATETNVLIIGAGGIGSWLSLFLARIGYDVTVVDNDRVDEHNIGGQLYGIADIGASKVYSLYKLVRQLTDVRISTFESLYQFLNLRGKHIVAVCVDNMAARKEILDDFKQYPGELPWGLLVDGRLSAEQFQVYFVTKDRIADYEKTLFDDKLLPDEPCTNKATTHFGAGIAYVMTKGINNFVAIGSGEPRRLPFVVQEEGFVFTQNII